jgi:hypothetical protein
VYRVEEGIIMELKTKFDILQKVKIKELDQSATIIKFEYQGIEPLYNVQYWWNGELKYVWLLERELE